MQRPAISYFMIQSIWFMFYFTDHARSHSMGKIDRLNGCIYIFIRT